jgi:8-oxo-dGTP pyrophosphatase MutT (NUDIX family)
MTIHISCPLDTTQAATVILTREHAGKLQAYLLKRSPNIGFMAGNFVFPGGVLDDEDRHFSIFKNHIDMDLVNILTRLGGGLPEEQVLACCVAAIRETFEEAGVFLAHRDDEFETDLEQVRRLRLAGDLEKDWFKKMVVNTKCRLALSALSRWSHWITPELMKRRFDTRFFIAAMPPDQFCRPDTIETVEGLWISPEEGLAGNLVGKIPLSPPTLVTLHELLKYSNHKDLHAAGKRRQWGQPLLPRLVPLEEGAVIVEPWDPMYRQEKININPNKLAASVLPVGRSFSRIWQNEGIWKPVKI